MSGDATKSQLGCLVVIMIAFGCAFIMFGMHDFRIAEQGVHVQGVVTAVRPEIHDSVEYKFEYDGSSYSGTGRRTGSETLGSLVTVSFEPAHPEFSLVTDPTDEGWGNLMPGLFAFATALIILGLLPFVGRERRAP